MLNWLVFWHRPFCMASFFNRAAGLLSLWLLFGCFFNRPSSISEGCNLNEPIPVNGCVRALFPETSTNQRSWHSCKLRQRWGQRGPWDFSMLHPSYLPMTLAGQQLEVGLHLHIPRKIGPCRARQVTDLETWAWRVWVPARQHQGSNVCLGAQSHRVPPCSGLLPRSFLWVPHPIFIPSPQHTFISWRLTVLSSPG